MAEGRQEVEDCRNNRLVDEEKHKADINLLSLVLGVFGSWALSGRFWVFLGPLKFQAFFQRFWLLRWALHSRYFSQLVGS